MNVNELYSKSTLNAAKINNVAEKRRNQNDRIKREAVMRFFPHLINFIEKQIELQAENGNFTCVVSVDKVGRTGIEIRGMKNGIVCACDWDIYRVVDEHFTQQGFSVKALPSIERTNWYISWENAVTPLDYQI